MKRVESEEARRLPIAVSLPKNLVTKIDKISKQVVELGNRSRTVEQALLNFIKVIEKTKFSKEKYKSKVNEKARATLTKLKLSRSRQ